MDRFRKIGRSMQKGFEPCFTKDSAIAASYRETGMNGTETRNIFKFIINVAES